MEKDQALDVVHIRVSVFGKSFGTKQKASCSATPTSECAGAQDPTSRPAIQCHDHILCFTTPSPPNHTRVFAVTYLGQMQPRVLDYGRVNVEATAVLRGDSGRELSLHYRGERPRSCQNWRAASPYLSTMLGGTTYDDQ